MTGDVDDGALRAEVVPRTTLAALNLLHAISFVLGGVRSVAIPPKMLGALAVVALKLLSVATARVSLCLKAWESIMTGGTYVARYGVRQEPA